MTEARRASVQVLVLTQYFPPETGAPQARLFELSTRLARLGLSVEVLTALPSYPKGRVFDGYRRKLVVREQFDGLSVIRTPVYPSKSVRVAPRLLSYFSFMFSSLFFGAFLVRKPRVIVVESPPLFLGVSALILKWVFRAKLIFNVSDLWPESAIFMGVIKERSLSARLSLWLERFLYSAADVCTGQSVGIIKGITRACPSVPVELVPNGCDTSVFCPEKRDSSFREKYSLGESIVVGYAGLLGMAQGVGVILNVANSLRDLPNVRFVILGDGPEKEDIVREANRLNLANLKFCGHVERSAMAGIVASFDVALIPLRHSIPGALPSKIYEAMAVGAPVVFAGDGDGAELIETAGAGIVVPYADTDKIAEALRNICMNDELRRNYGTSGRQFVMENRDRASIAERFATLVTKLGNSEYSIASMN